MQYNEDDAPEFTDVDDIDDMDNIAATLFEGSRVVREEASALASALGQMSADFSNYLGGHFKERPYLTLGTAVGLGYLLATGIPPRFVSFVLSSSARLVASRLANEFLGNGKISKES